MSRKTLSLTVLCLLGFGLLLYTAPDGVGARDDTETAGAESEVSRSSRAIGSVGQASGFALNPALALWQDHHRPIGYLSQEDTEALIAKREAAAEALATLIGGMSPGDLDAVLRAIQTTDRTRDKLVMIEGLRRNPSAEALSVLEELYRDEGGYTLQSNILRALGDSESPGHTDLLTEQMWSADDERLQQLAAQALYGEPDAVSTLTQAIDSELPMKVRLEAIHSLGATGTGEAQQALEEIADSEDTEQRIRAYADQELVRSFG